MSSIIPSPSAPGDPPWPLANGQRAHTPVLVVGAGPVGLSTALALARCGVPTLLLEAGPERDADYFANTGSKAICFQRDVLDVFDRFGAADRLVAEGTTWTTARTYYRQHEVRTVTFPDDSEGSTASLPPWINISQARVEQELLRQADAEPLIAIRYEHELTGMSQDREGVTAHVRKSGSHTLSLRGSHLVGADGPRSTVRGLLGVEFPGESFADRFLICDIRAELPFPNERRFFFDPEWNPGRQVLLHQCPNSVWRIDWQVPDGYDLQEERDSGALDRRIRKIVGEQPYEVVWSSVYQFHERCAVRFTVGRVLLAGDAAHLYAPFGARGLNSGVQDAENLGWKIALARDTNVKTAELLLDSYHTERWEAAQENLRVTGETMRFLVPHNDADARRRRETLQRAVTDTAAQSEIDSGKLAEPYWYPESPLTTPAPTAETIPEQPGRYRPPVPGVLCPDGPCQVAEHPEVNRLRQLFGPGFTVLTATPSQGRVVAEAATDLPVPVSTYALSEIDTTGELAWNLQNDGETIHIIRPDAHLCAVLPAHATPDVVGALWRACGEAAPTRTAPQVRT